MRRTDWREDRPTIGRVTVSPLINIVFPFGQRNACQNNMQPSTTSATLTPCRNEAGLS